MRSGAGGRALGASLRVVRRSMRTHRSCLGTAFAVVISALTSGCTTDGQPIASVFGGGRTAAIAFETIDGPPVGVFRKLVQTLDEEAQARQVVVVPHDGQAQYRIRGYLAANVRRGETEIAWVWDVYDSEQRRRLRITGEERAGRAGRNAWAAADEAVLRRIAQNGMDRLVAFLGSPGPAPAPVGASEIAVAGLRSPDDFSPESWGIFQIFASKPAVETAAQATPQDGAEIPLPRRRPHQTAGAAPTAALAFMPPGR